MARSATTTDALSALAEPRRRHILDAIGTGERTVNQLVEVLGLEQPYVSKHLRVLREVQVVSVRDDGRQRWYRVNGQALRPIHQWLATFERTWNQRFDQLDVVLEDLSHQEAPHEHPDHPQSSSRPEPAQSQRDAAQSTGDPDHP